MTDAARLFLVSAGVAIGLAAAAALLVLALCHCALVVALLAVERLDRAIAGGLAAAVQGLNRAAVRLREWRR